MVQDTASTVVDSFDISAMLQQCADSEGLQCVHVMTSTSKRVAQVDENVQFRKL